MVKLLAVGIREENDMFSRSVNRFFPDNKVFFVQDRKKWIETAKKEQPDLIILDVTAADDNGWVRALRQIRLDNTTTRIPVILFGDSNVSPGVISEGLKAGACSFWSWPVDELLLAAQIKAILREKADRDSLVYHNEMLERILQDTRNKVDERTYELAQRIKELRCLYGISALREKPDITLEEIIQGIVDLIPSSCQYPKITCTRIIMGYQEFKSDNFRETPWKYSCDITINGEWGGTIELCYLQRPKDEDKVFIAEERNLLDVIAERLGRIAERVRTDESLRAESRNIINILGSVEDLIYRVNEQYEIEYINPALEKELGPVKGKKCFEYFIRRREVCDSCKIADVLGGTVVRREWYFAAKNKTYDVLETPIRNPDGSVSKLSILRDLTALKRAQKELEERELLYRSLTESVADGVILVQKGEIVFANRAVVDMFEFASPKEVIGTPVERLFDKDFRPVCKKMFDPMEDDSDIGLPNWALCVTRSGKKIWVSTNRSIISLKSKLAILATMRNITDQVLWEKSIQEETEYLRKENIKLKSSIKERYRFGNLIGRSPAMQSVYELILKAADSDANVIILGESGTGKELVARGIHDLSARADRPFVPVNCGAIPEQLAESEFFGYRKGSFTGAHRDNAGYIYAANKATLFLDEVGELDLSIQVKFLRVLESGEYTPIGDTRVYKSDFRVISATNRDFAKMVLEGRVREDFYYRISVIPIVIAPLRERKEDIPLLVEHFLRLYSKGKKDHRLPAKYIDVLCNYDWPGNVRELQGVIQRYIAMGSFEFFNMGEKEIKPVEISMDLDGEIQTGNLRKAVENFERRFILNALNQNNWHRGKVASILGVNSKTLYLKMKKQGFLTRKSGKKSL